MRRECMVYNNTLPFKLFQRNLIRRLSLLGVNQISINLCRGDILMRQHLRYCVNVCALRDLDDRIRVPKAVEQNTRSKQMKR